MFLTSSGGYFQYLPLENLLFHWCRNRLHKRYLISRDQFKSTSKLYIKILNSQSKRKKKNLWGAQSKKIFLSYMIYKQLVMIPGKKKVNITKRNILGLQARLKSYSTFFTLLRNLRHFHKRQNPEFVKGFCYVLDIYFLLSVSQWKYNRATIFLAINWLL